MIAIMLVTVSDRSGDINTRIDFVACKDDEEQEDLMAAVDLYEGANDYDLVGWTNKIEHFGPGQMLIKADSYITDELRVKDA